MTLYTALIVIVWATLIVLTILVIENDRISKKVTTVMLFTYGVVAAAASAEWLAVQFNGNLDIHPWAIKIAKFFDYSLGPLAGASIVFQLQSKSIWKKILMGIIAFNFVFQFISLFTDWMIVVDNTTNTYTHATVYPLYIVIFVLVAIFDTIEFASYGRKFRRQNRISLYAILLFVLMGAALQEAIGGEVRTSYLCLSVGFVMLFIHISEFSQIKSDDRIQEQKIQISIDALTGLHSRYAYIEDIEKLEKEAYNPNLVVVTIDINELKRVNDTLGHAAGDDLIRGAASVVSSTFDKYGKSYRTGGDEFVVIASIEKGKIEKLISNLNKSADKWVGKDGQTLSLSLGYAEASEYPEINIDKLVSASDKEMYNAKARYYLQNGIERRRT